MGRILKDLTGQVFGRLTAQWPVGFNRHHQTMWLTSCVCGALKIVQSGDLTCAHTQSCGCLRSELHLQSATKHGHKRRGHMTREYTSWQHMKNRCTNPYAKDYIHYGARGIRVCPQWMTSFETFLSDMGPKPEGLTLERMDNNGDYTPTNCKWATQKEQVHNRRPSIRKH